MAGTKYDQGKLRFDLVPPEVLEQVAAVMTFGANKYGDNNWQEVENGVNRYYAAAMRHLQADRKGELLDSESGLPHLAHAMTCLGFLLWKQLTPQAEPKKPGCKVPPELEPLLEWLGPSNSILYLDNAVDLSRVALSKPAEFIGRAFRWGHAPEGVSFWSNLHDDWVAHINKNRDEAVEVPISVALTAELLAHYLFTRKELQNDSVA